VPLANENLVSRWMSVAVVCGCSWRFELSIAATRAPLKNNDPLTLLKVSLRRAGCALGSLRSIRRESVAAVSTGKLTLHLLAVAAMGLEAHPGTALNRLAVCRILIQAVANPFHVVDGRCVLHVEEPRLQKFFQRVVNQ
jgi:hypothetical protein